MVKFIRTGHWPGTAVVEVPQKNIEVVMVNSTTGTSMISSYYWLLMVNNGY